MVARVVDPDTFEPLSYGEEGLLRLLEKDGWTIKRLDS